MDVIQLDKEDQTTFCNIKLDYNQYVTNVHKLAANLVSLGEMLNEAQDVRQLGLCVRELKKYCGVKDFWRMHKKRCRALKLLHSYEQFHQK